MSIPADTRLPKPSPSATIKVYLSFFFLAYIGRFEGC